MPTRGVAGGVGQGRRVPWLPIIALPLVLLATFLVLNSLLFVPTTDLRTQEALEGFDFSTGIGSIDRDLTDFWSGELYTPDDFASGSVGEPDYPASEDASTHDESRQGCRFGTYRIVLDLPAGQTFAISSDSATYAQRMWVNGELVSEVGTVSDSAEGFVPRTRHYVVAFTAGDGPTEIVIQRANFAHTRGTLFELYLGPQAQVFHLAEADMVASVLPLGVLLTAGLLFLGVGLFLTDQRQFLWFSFACLSLMVRDSFVNPKPVMVLLPELDWYLGHRLEQVSLIASMLFLLLFYNTVLRGAMNKHVQRVGYALCLAGIAIYALLPSTIYSSMTQGVVYVIAGYLVVFCISVIASVVKHRVDWRRTENLLLVAGFLAAAIPGIIDALLYRRTLDNNFNQVGMMAFVFLNMVALTLEMRRAQEELAVAGEREEQMLQANRTLSDLYRMRSEIMRDISHEMRTPLTVMGSYAGLARRQIQMGAVNERTVGNLDVIEHEAVRLGRMVEQMKDVDSEKGLRLARSNGDVASALRQAASFCEPVCARHGNRIVVDVPDGELVASFMPDGVLQVLYNLVSNASRHCRQAVITLRARRAAQGGAEVSVIDHGNGMSPELVARAFESGVSGDAGSGLGLAICRQIVEDGGGTIGIESTPGVGTTVTFTLPAGDTEGEG